jgi:hypothetical protein
MMGLTPTIGSCVESVKANSAHHIKELVWDLLEQPAAHRFALGSHFHHFLLPLEGSHEYHIVYILHLNSKKRERDWKLLFKLPLALLQK